MVLSAKLKTTSGAGGDGGWGGFLLIFFPSDDNSSKKKTIFSFPDSSSSTTTTKKTPSSRSSSPVPLISKFQSTLSICLLLFIILFFSTLLLFTLSQFDSTLRTPHHPSSSRRLLIPQQMRGGGGGGVAALQGMGRMFRRGTRSMGELIVAHVPDDIEAVELRSFVRSLHFSGVLARSDLAFLFSVSSESTMAQVAEEEIIAFDRVLEMLFDESNRTRSQQHGLLTRYLRGGGGAENNNNNSNNNNGTEVKKEKETIWGKGMMKKEETESGELTRASYGSVVGFEVAELDPEDSLSGFVVESPVVPIGLRRWACYPMLLGRVKRNFKHLILIDVKEMLILGDPFARIRARGPESVTLWTNSNSDSDPEKRGRRRGSDSKLGIINPWIVAGGGRGVRRFAAAVVTEIVRVTLQHKGGSKGRNSVVTESGVVNRLVRDSGHVLKNVNMEGTESVVEASQLGGLNSVAQPNRPGGGGGGGGVLLVSNYSAVVQRGRRNFDVDFALNVEVCSSKFYSLVYGDC